MKKKRRKKNKQEKEKIPNQRLEESKGKRGNSQSRLEERKREEKIPDQRLEGKQKQICKKVIGTDDV